MEISISQIKTFKACRRAYYLRYHENLHPIEKSDALETGSSYHERLEALYKGEPIPSDYSKAEAMSLAYAKYIMPRLHIVEPEKKFSVEITEDLTLIGRYDGIADDGNIVEHKTTGETSLESYEYDLQWDEQVLAYMLASGKRKIYYTVCRKPTIRMKKDETEEEFFKRMCEWYDTDTDEKIRMFEVIRTDAEVEEFKQDLIRLYPHMVACEDESECYKNTTHCHRWGTRCEYAGICLHYDRTLQYCDFEKRDREEYYGNEGRDNEF